MQVWGLVLHPFLFQWMNDPTGWLTYCSDYLECLWEISGGHICDWGARTRTCATVSKNSWTLYIFDVVLKLWVRTCHWFHRLWCYVGWTCFSVVCFMVSCCGHIAEQIGHFFQCLYYVMWGSLLGLARESEKGGRTVERIDLWFLASVTAAFRWSCWSAVILVDTLYHLLPLIRKNMAVIMSHPVFNGRCLLTVQWQWSWVTQCSMDITYSMLIGIGITARPYGEWSTEIGSP